MPTILIVDDETIFRRGLRTMITAIDPDWTVAGEARDGYEALDLLEELRPDAMLTDIRMPNMDGLQLQRIARERFPDLRCAVISGYDDFVYVQQSLRSGVRDYVLKPVEREELRDVLEVLKEEVMQFSGSQRHAMPTEADLAVRTQIEDYLAASLARGVIDEQELLNLLRQTGRTFGDPWFACFVIKLDKASVSSDRYERADPTLFQLYIQQFVQEMLCENYRSFCFTISDSEVVAIINMPHETAEDKGRLLHTAEKIRQEIKQLSKLTVTIGVGRVKESVCGLPAAYREAEIALLYRLIYGGDKVLNYETMNERREPSAPRRWSWDRLERSVSEGNAIETAEQTAAIITELCMKMTSPETVQQQVCKMIIYYYELAEQLQLTREWLGDREIRTILFELCSISSREELIEACAELLIGLNRCISECEAKPVQDPIEQALRYMAAHYGQSITLKEMADRVFLNPAYFSTLIKQRTGKTFVEHLTEIRITEAKRRLTFSDDKIVVIAEATGFANLRHFNRVFKNETGMSPSDYRDAMRLRTSIHQT